MRIGDNASTPNRLTHFLSVSGRKRDWMERYTKIFIRSEILGSHSSDNE
jgi:hypothetical protein